MRRPPIALLFALGFTITLVAQTPAQVPPAAPTPAPATQKPVVRAPARPMTVTIQVTDASGSPLADTKVTIVSGPVLREGATTADGSLRLANMRAGTYRLRFVREGSMTLERDVTIRAGEPLAIDVSLNAAPPPPKVEPPKPPEPPPSKTLPPPGESKVTPVPAFLDKNFISGRDPRKDSALGCAATGTATLHQLRDAWTNHTHDDADEWIYVVAGEGTLRINSGADQRIQAGTFSLVPHTVGHSVTPQGRNPLIVISVLSGPACKG